MALSEREHAALRKAIHANGAAAVVRLDYGIYEVPSSAGDGTTYLVCGVAMDGSDFTCTCRAAEVGQPCWHRAAVRLRRVQEDAKRQWGAIQRKRAAAQAGQAPALGLAA